MDKQTLVAVIGFGAAAVGLLAAVLGRKRVIIVRHVYREARSKESSNWLGLFGILILIGGMAVGVVMIAVHLLTGPTVKADLAEYQKQDLVAKGPAYLQKTAPERIKRWRQAAEKGSSQGQFLFGRCLLEGAGIAKDEAESVVWLRKAAEQGLAPAQ